MKKIKDFILRKLGILSMKKRIDLLEKENKSFKKKLEDSSKRISTLSNQNKELNKRISNLEKFVFSQNRSLVEVGRSPRIVVSMTSYPARINKVHVVLERLLVQTVRPDKIILWLSKEQFPNKEADLPETLLRLIDDRIEIGWCDGDIKSYKKILPALREYSEDLIVTVDDDLIYDADFIENLYMAHKKFPTAIIASRVHKIAFDEQGKIAPYAKWDKECGYGLLDAREDWFFTSGAGTLLPPHIFGEGVFDLDTIINLCPHADDIWLNIHAAMNEVPIVNTANNNYLTCVEGTQGDRLYDINKEQNDVQLKRVVDYYKEQLTDSIYKNM